MHTLYPSGMSVVACLLISACGHVPVKSPLRQDDAATEHLRRLASDVVTRAVAGERKHGDLDVMLGVEAEVPGFAGFYFGEDGTPVVRLREQNGEQLQRARGLLVAAYAKHHLPNVRELAMRFTSARPQSARFALSELVAFHEATTHARTPESRIVAVGVDVASNRLRIAVVNDADLPLATALLTRLAIPPEAVTFRVLPGPPTG